MPLRPGRARPQEAVCPRRRLRPPLGDAVSAALGPVALRAASASVPPPALGARAGGSVPRAPWTGGPASSAARPTRPTRPSLPSRRPEGFLWLAPSDTSHMWRASDLHARQSLFTCNPTSVHTRVCVSECVHTCVWPAACQDASRQQQTGQGWGAPWPETPPPGTGWAASASGNAMAGSFEGGHSPMSSRLVTSRVLGQLPGSFLCLVRLRLWNFAVGTANLASGHSELVTTVPALMTLRRPRPAGDGDR